MKKQDGVSMFEVVIAIIILLIIAFFAIFNAQNTIPKAKATEVYSEMKSVEAAVEFIHGQLAANDSFQLEMGKHYDKLGDETDTYVIYGLMNHNSTSAADYLGIKNLKRDYVVDYVSGTFELVEEADIQGTSVKTLGQVESLINQSTK